MPMQPNLCQHSQHGKQWQQRLRLYLALIRLTPATGWLLLLWPTLTALWLAAGGFPGWHLLAVFTLGTVLMHSAGCCINDVADRNFDLHVKRTCQRPVTTGQISVREALLVGAALLLAAFALVLTTNWQAIVCSVPALLIALAYPFAKRHVAMPQAVLGLAFGMGMPMAYAAVRGSVPWATMAVMLLANLCWTLAYDTEYAMVDRDDDLKIGIKTSAITLGRWEVAAIALFYLLHIGLWWGLFWQYAQAAWGYSRVVWAATLLAAVAQALWHIWLIGGRERKRCLQAFLYNHWLGCTGFVAACALV